MDTQKTPTPAAKKRSAAAQERLDQIVSAAVRLINARGFNGMSLQAVADEVGITQAGVLHYVGSKHGLLVEVIRRYYDRSSTLDDYLSLFHPGGAFEGQSPKIPECCRLLVAENNSQPELVMLFQMLNTEAMSTESPLHEYFNDRSRGVIEPEPDVNWSVPEGIDATEAISCALAAMYGLEGRWVARPDEIDYPAEWSKFEDILFPLPLWEGYR
ncbi:TetR/AcrR family transcriptional regulator [Collinsella sp. CM84Y_54]|uniref:TetR/AcrR family transcriptional regulator n=1 Tax=Collinsella sp. CM84Y_54 TaxID=3085309 RepID=UPI002E764DAF|nr:TetR/AcrR family transcriptional regulator [Collinsella sp. CM84Y_54]